MDFGLRSPPPPERLRGRQGFLAPEERRPVGDARSHMGMPQWGHAPRCLPSGGGGGGTPPSPPLIPPDRPSRLLAWRLEAPKRARGVHPGCVPLHVPLPTFALPAGPPIAPCRNPSGGVGLHQEREPKL